MSRTAFPSERFSFCNCSSSAYLVPFYRRPFQLLEMVRVLKTGGLGVMTGPNERFSAWQYSLRMWTSNLSTYLNPFNLVVVHRLGPWDFSSTERQKNGGTPLIQLPTRCARHSGLWAANRPESSIGRKAAAGGFFPPLSFRHRRAPKRKSESTVYSRKR